MKNGNKNLIVFSLVFAVILVGLIFWQKENNAAPGNQKAEVASTVPYLLPNLPLKQIFTDSLLISGTLEEYNPTTIKLYYWLK